MHAVIRFTITTQNRPATAFSCGAISFQAEGKKLLEEHAIAPARCKALLSADQPTNQKTVVLMIAGAIQ